MDERHYNSPQGAINKQDISAVGIVRTLSSHRTFFLCVVVIISLLSYSSYSQTIKIVRDKSDLGRGNFVTATQMFGIDIVVDGIKNCTGASFELLYDAADVVVYSNFKARDLGNGILVTNRSDSAKRTGRLLVNVSSGITVGQPGIDTPTVVRLNFVVLPSAKNGRVFTFSFNKPRVNSSDVIGQVFTPTWQPTPMTINGFITVYPGDANNDRIVGVEDGAVVGSYLGQGSGRSSIRGFRREPASTLWLPQTALVWDSSGVTYADCDGSGDITSSDLLVVNLNIDKSYGIQTPPKGDRIQSGDIDNYNYTSDDTRLILSAQLQRSAKAIASEWRVKLREPHNMSEKVFLGFTPDWLYSSGVSMYKAFHPDPDDMYSGVLYLTFGSGKNTNLSTGTIGELHIPRELGNNIESMQMEQATAITNGGTIFNVAAVSLKTNSTSSVESDASIQAISVSPQPCNGVVHISYSGSQSCTLQIVNTLGEVLSTYHVESGELTIDVAQLPIGVYTLAFSDTSDSHSQRVPMVVVR
jgi:hypothetical protein